MVDTLENPAFQDKIMSAKDQGEAAPAATVDAVATLLSATVSLWILISSLVAIWPPLVLCALLACVPAAFTDVALARKNIDDYRQAAPHLRAKMLFERILTLPDAQKDIQAFSMGSILVQKSERHQQSINGISLRSAARGVVADSAALAISGIAGVVGLLGLSARTISGVATVGDAVLYVGILTLLDSVARDVARTCGEFRTRSEFFDDFESLANAGPACGGHRPSPPPLRRAITFENVSYYYPGASRPALDGVNVEFKAGTNIALLGLNGSGKSTLVRLLLGLSRPTSGRILWDGVDISEFDLESYRRRCSAVFQDFMVLDLTLAENICLDPAQRTLDSLTAAAEAAQLKENMKKFPHGFGTLISNIMAPPDGQEATKLSGGEAQRVAVARALHRPQADVLVLDEPSSGLDAIAESALLDSVRSTRRHLLTITITHRMYEVRKSDTIVLMEHGKVIECGAHAALLALGGRYASMCAKQGVD